MTQTHTVTLITLLAISGCASPTPVSPWEKRPDNPSVEEAQRRIMSTDYKVRIWRKGGASVDRAFEAAFAELARVARIADNDDPASEISRVNNQADRVATKTSPELFSLIQLSQQMWQRSDGAFDVTFVAIQEETEKYGSKAGLGGGAAEYGSDVAAALKTRVGNRNVALDAAASTVRYGKPGMKIGLKGLAKGHAAQKAAEKLLAMRELAGFAVVGGGVFVAGGEALKDPGLMCIEHSNDLGKCLYKVVPAPETRLFAMGRGASADRPGHIYDPKSGMRKAKEGGSTVAGTDGAWVQAYATVLSITDNRKSEAFIARNAAQSPTVRGVFYESGYSIKLNGNFDPLAKIIDPVTGKPIEEPAPRGQRTRTAR